MRDANAHVHVGDHGRRHVVDARLAELPELEEAVGEDEVGLGKYLVLAGAQPGHADLAALQWPEDGVKAPGVRRVLLGIVPASLGWVISGEDGKRAQGTHRNEGNRRRVHLRIDDVLRI